jgi:PKD domain
MQLKSLKKRKPRRRKNARHWTLGRFVRLMVEILEDRVAPSASPGAANPLPVGDLPPVPANLGFESGLADWNVNTDTTGAVKVVSQFNAAGGTDPNTKVSVPPTNFNPVEGNHFALLTTASVGSDTTLSKSFAIGQGGQLICFAAFFDAGDYAPFNDYGDVVLYKDSTPLVTLFAESIHGGAGLDADPPVPLLAPLPDGSTMRNGVGSYGSTPWTTVEYAIKSPGNYSLVARTANTGDNALDSYLGLDDIQFLGPAEISANAGSGYTVPAGGSVILRGFGTVAGSNDVVYAWDLNYDGATFQPSAFGQQVVFHADNLAPGTVQTVALQVSDGTHTVIDTTTVTVTSQPPIFGAARPGPINLGTALDFQLPFSDSDSSTWTAKVDYGDGTVETLTNDQLVNGQVPLFHSYMKDRTFPVTVSVTDSSGASASTTFGVVVNPVLATINVGDPITVETGAAVDRTITFTSPLVENWTVSFDPLGTGNLTPFTGPVSISNVALGVNSFDFHTSYNQPGTYNVEFSLDNGFDPPQNVFLLINVFSPSQFLELTNSSSQTVTDSSQTTQTKTVSGTALDGSPTHLDASLGAGFPVGSSVFTASYTDNPFATGQANAKSVIKVSGSTLASPVAFFDVRASFVGPVLNPKLTCTFTLEVNPGQDIDALQVLYSSGTNPDGSPIWLVFDPDPQFPVIRTILGTDTTENKEIVQIQVTYDNNSSPSISDLHGTVFTIAVPAPPGSSTTTPVTGPLALSFGTPPATPLTTAFSGDSGGTFVLSVSQPTNFSASRTEAATAFSSVTSGASWNDLDIGDPMNLAAFDDSWYLRALATPADDLNPGAPADGADEQYETFAPMVPDNANQQSRATVRNDALSTVFEGPSFEAGDLASAALDLLQPKPVEPTISRDTRVHAAWAIWSASAALEGGARALERKRRRPELELLPV